MATISFNIPDAILPRVVTALCTRYDYATNKQETETENQFARRMMIDVMKREVVAADRELAVRDAVSAVGYMDMSSVT